MIMGQFCHEFSSNIIASNKFLPILLILSIILRKFCIVSAVRIQSAEEQLTLYNNNNNNNNIIIIIMMNQNNKDCKKQKHTFITNKAHFDLQANLF